MQSNQETRSGATEKLTRALLNSVGDNDSYPTPEEIAVHKRRANVRLKYPNLTFAIYPNSKPHNRKEHHES